MDTEYNVRKWDPEQAGQSLCSLSTEAVCVLLVGIFGLNKQKKNGKRMVNFPPFLLDSNLTTAKAPASS